MTENNQEFIPHYCVFVRWKRHLENVEKSTSLIDDDIIKQIWKREHEKRLPDPIRFITIEKYISFCKSRVVKRFYFDEAGEIVKTRKG